MVRETALNFGGCHTEGASKAETEGTPKAVGISKRVTSYLMSTENTVEGRLQRENKKTYQSFRSPNPPEISYGRQCVSFDVQLYEVFGCVHGSSVGLDVIPD